MGMSVSYPLIQEPESYVDPDYNEESKEMDFALGMHEINLKFTYNMIQQRIRSIKEQTMFEKYRYDWSNSVKELKAMYPDWSEEDILNLRRLFELFDNNGDRLLDFNEFNAALNIIKDDTTEEQREAYFEQADSGRYNSINFKEFLQLMYGVKQGTPIPRPPESEDDKDTVTNDLICNVTRMDTFQQMCYGVF